MLTKLLAVVASLASAVVVRDAVEFRAELARGAPSIELVMHGEFTCCRLGHPDEEPCDREALMLPLLGLYADVYAQRNGKVGSNARS